MGPVSQMKAWLLGSATLVAGIGLAAVLYTASRGPEPVAGLPASPSVSPAPDVLGSGASGSEAVQPAEPEAEGLPPAPAIDVVRVAEDGGALVAGSAVAGAAVVLRVDGLTVAETSADSAGQFVALFMLAPSDAVQMMTLEMALADGRTVVSDDRVVLAPRPEVALAMVDAAPDSTTLALAAVREDAPEAPSVMPPALPEAQAPGHEQASAVLGSSVGGGDASASERAQIVVGEAPAAPETPPGPVAEAIAAAPAEGGAEAVAETVQGAVGEGPVPSEEAPPAAEATVVVEQVAAVEPAAEPEERVEAATEERAGERSGERSGEAADVAAAAPVIGAETLAAATLPADTLRPDALSADALPTGLDAPQADLLPTEALSPVALPDGSEADDTRSLAQAGTDLIPRAFVLRGSGEVALVDRAPQVMDNVVIDLIAYSDEGDVQISGRAAHSGSGARLQIYLDNQPIAMAVSENGDWASDLPDVDPGIYSLRVDQLGSEGQVVSRFETPFQREDPALVRAAQARAEPAEAGPVDAEATVTASADTAPVQTAAATLEPQSAAAAPSEAATGAANEPVAATPQAGAPVAQDSPDTSAAPAGQENTLVAAPEPATAPQPTQAAPAQPSVGLITVQPGHSLWRISEGHYGAGDRYLVIYNANRSQIRNPDLIYPGQVFALPD